MNRTGWECPRCCVVNGPHVDQCRCSGPKSVVDQELKKAQEQLGTFNSSDLFCQLCGYTLYPGIEHTCPSGGFKNG